MSALEIPRYDVEKLSLRAWNYARDHSDFAELIRKVPNIRHIYAYFLSNREGDLSAFFEVLMQVVHADGMNLNSVQLETNDILLPEVKWERDGRLTFLLIIWSHWTPWPAFYGLLHFHCG